VYFELTSTLQTLTSWPTQIELTCVGSVLTQQFEQEPQLPGVILTEAGDYIGMISRRRFFEQMSRPYSLELFASRTIARLRSTLVGDTLILPCDTTIIYAIQMALQRSPTLLYEPLLVEFPDGYRVLDFQELLLAYLQINTLSLQNLQLAEQSHRAVQENLRQFQSTYVEQLQSDKMVSLQQLVAGVAHEIYNPVNFIHGNLPHANAYINDLFELIELYQTACPAVPAAVEAKLAAIDFEFIKHDLPELITSLRGGTDRVHKIVQSLRVFSRLDEADYKAVDLHACLDSALLVLQNRFNATPDRPTINVIKKYGQLPLVECFAGRLNQVFMSIFNNAIEALEDHILESIAHHEIYCAPTISINTEVMDEGWVMITIANNGAEIPEAIRHRLFEPFFTTKSTSKATGLGLSISYQIVTTTHGGRLLCPSSIQGAEFVIQIPLTQLPAPEPIQVNADCWSVD
jgi:signal transduction histidine kinase